MSNNTPILWLASWYPNRLDPYTGDFIQRHARAVSSLRKVHVIFLRRDESLKPGTMRIETSTTGSLCEEIAFYNSRGSGSIGKLLSLFYFLASYRKLILGFIAEYGHPSLVHVHVGLKAGLLAIWMKKSYGIPYLLTEHWTGYNSAAEPNIWQQGRVARWVAASVIRHASVVMPVSTDLGNLMQRVEPLAKIRVINNVVDTGRFYLSAKNPGFSYTFMHASSLTPQKNPELLLHAFASLKKENNWKLIIAGPYRENLHHLAKDLQIDQHVEWRGEISYAEVAKAMQHADCFVLSSRYENSPCVIAEALCSGLPVVSTNVGGISELIDSTNGILVQEGSRADLEKAIRSMLMKEINWNQVEIAQTASQKFAYPVVAASIERFYEEVLKLQTPAD